MRRKRGREEGRKKGGREAQVGTKGGLEPWRNREDIGWRESRWRGTRVVAGNRSSFLERRSSRSRASCLAFPRFSSSFVCLFAPNSKSFLRSLSRGNQLLLFPSDFPIRSHAYTQTHLHSHICFVRRRLRRRLRKTRDATTLPAPEHEHERQRATGKGAGEPRETGSERERERERVVAEEGK